jgi:hypothetical protein
MITDPEGVACIVGRHFEKQDSFYELHQSWNFFLKRKGAVNTAPL